MTPSLRTITGPLTIEMREAAQLLFEQIPSRDLLLITPGKRGTKPLSATNDPGYLSTDGRLRCEEVRDRSWFRTFARHGQLVVHANNGCAKESALLFIHPSNTGVLFESETALWPPSLAFSAEQAKRAIEALVELTEDPEMIERMADLPLVVVTQMGAEPNDPPELALTLAQALQLEDGIGLLEETHIGLCQGVRISPLEVELCR